MQRIHVKNMVCRHCVSALVAALVELGIPHGKVDIGSFEVEEIPSGDILRRLDSRLAELGFERVTDHDSAVAEAVRRAVNEHVSQSGDCRLKLSACLERQLGISYDTASRIFRRVEGRTVEQYHILRRVELVKELLECGGRSLAEIADVAGYSSAAHLSRQFKQVTGMTPTAYLADPHRRSLNDL